MPGVKSDFHIADSMTPFELFSEDVSTNQTHLDVTSYIDMRSSVTASQNNVAVVLSGATNATANVALYVKPGSGSVTDYVLVEKKENIEANSITIFTDVYAGLWKIVLTSLSGGPFDVHVSYSDTKGQFVLPAL